MFKYSTHKLNRILHIKSIISAFEVTYNEKFNFKGEMHNFWELVYVLDGKIGVAADNKIYELSKGQLIFHKPMEFHRLWSEGGTKPHLIIISFETEGLGMKNFENGLFQLSFENEKVIINLINEVHIAFVPTNVYSLSLRKPENAISIQLIATTLEFFLLSILKDVITSKVQINTQSAINYRHVINILNENIYENLCVDKIAKLCNMSTSNLKKTFQKYSGEGVIEYFNHMKIRKSISLIEEGLSISEISDKLSFSSQNYFSTVFKRETGCSPTNYKESRLISFRKVNNL